MRVLICPYDVSRESCKPTSVLNQVQPKLGSLVHVAPHCWRSLPAVAGINCLQHVAGELDID
jgi:hypothetical protein